MFFGGIIMPKYTYRDGCEHAPRQLENLNGILDAYPVAALGLLRVRLLYGLLATRQRGHFHPTSFKQRTISRWSQSGRRKLAPVVFGSCRYVYTSIILLCGLSNHLVACVQMPRKGEHGLQPSNHSWHHTAS